MLTLLDQQSQQNLPRWLQGNSKCSCPNSTAACCYLFLPAYWSAQRPVLRSYRTCPPVKAPGAAAGCGAGGSMAAGQRSMCLAVYSTRVSVPKSRLSGTAARGGSAGAGPRRSSSYARYSSRVVVLPSNGIWGRAGNAAGGGTRRSSSHCLYSSRVVVLPSNGMCGRAGAAAGGAARRSSSHCLYASRVSEDPSNGTCARGGGT